MSLFIHAWHTYRAILGYPRIEKCRDCETYRIYNITSSLDEGDWYVFTGEEELQRIKDIIDGRKN
jgi:hypothetical protein